MALISEAEEARITHAITAAECSTSGEIVAVITASSSGYFYAPVLWAALIALALPWPLIYFTWWPMQWVFAAQLATFVVLLILFIPRPIRFRLVPKSVKRARAHRVAIEQFVAQNLHTTKGHTGVLIFVSVAERYAEIIADSAIDARVPPGTWKTIVDGLTRRIGEGAPADGFIDAIAAVGKLLAQHFPPGTEDPNELADHLIVLP